MEQNPHDIEDIPNLPDLTVAIRDLNERGQGVGTVQSDTRTDKICFVDGALPGETVTVGIVDEKKNYLVGELTDILAASPARQMSDCAYYPACGSCQLRHMTYEAETAFKRRRVVDALCHIGPLDEATAERITAPVRAMDRPVHYRGKSIFPIRPNDDPD
ncbi:MAG: TRAM domain-containing protein, partial [Saccharofermentanales bacterium]